jgi:thiamine-monophosphate kinase
MKEFEIIAKYFAPLSRDGLRDDAAVLSVLPGHALVVTSDTLNAGTHFLADATPRDIAHKVLRVNLSDLAAMGASPLSYQLNIAYPDRPSSLWLEAFTNALAADQKTFDIFCSGGDTTSIEGPLSISITALGLVPEGKAVRRGGAKAGDLIVLSGPVGNAFIGLEILRGIIANPEADYFIGQYYRPTPRLDLVDFMRAHAHAAIDISDGLIADLGHIAAASGLIAEIRFDDIPFSPQAKGLIDAGTVKATDMLTSGDDYQLVLAVPRSAQDRLPASCRIIGIFHEGAPDVKLLDGSGNPIFLPSGGWVHF